MMEFVRGNVRYKFGYPYEEDHCVLTVYLLRNTDIRTASVFRPVCEINVAGDLLLDVMDHMCNSLKDSAEFLYSVAAQALINSDYNIEGEDGDIYKLETYEDFNNRWIKI